MTVLVDSIGEEVAVAPRPVDFVNDEEKLCKEMVSNLTDEEKETAARSSYQYMSKSLAGTASPEDRGHYATAMALRCLRADKGDQAAALKRMRDTIAYREETDVDGLRRCFHERNHPDEATEKLYEDYRENIREQFGGGKSYVRGFDKEGRALFTLIPRLKNSEDPVWYLKGYVYMIERALAITERKTDGAQGKVVVFFDYSGYRSAHSPPLSLAKKLMYILADHYPERLQHVFVLDAPFAFRAFWVLIRPFIDPVTKSKVLFLTGEAAKRERLGVAVAQDQAERFMLPEGKMPSEIDMEEFLSVTAFDKAANE